MDLVKEWFHGDLAALSISGRIMCNRCGWAINPPSGQSHIDSAAWFGRSCMRGCDLSSKAANLIPRPRKHAPGC